MNLKTRVLLWTEKFKARWMSNFAAVGSQLKYGYIKGSMTGTDISMAASVVVRNKGGKFISLDASGYGVLIGATTTTIFGFVLAPQETTSATKGATSYYCISNKDAIFRILNINTAAAAFALTNLGKCASLEYTSTVTGFTGTLHQFVCLGTTAPALVRIVGGSTEANGWVDVQMRGGTTWGDLVIA